MTLPTAVKPLSGKQIAEMSGLISKMNPTDKQKERLDYLLKRHNNKGTAGAFTNSALAIIRDIYVLEKYGKSPVSLTDDYSLHAINGTLSESRSLELISDYTGLDFKVNKELIKNAYLKGKLDAYIGPSIKKAKYVIEVKTAKGMQSILDTIKKESLLKQYYWQLVGYMALTGAEIAEVYHVLVSYDVNIVNEMVKKYLNRIRNLNVPPLEVDTAIKRIQDNLNFDNIPVNERIVKVSLERNDDDIKMVKERVKDVRRCLEEYQKMHLLINS